MALSTGDRIPDVTLKTPTAEGPKDISTGSLFEGQRVVLFAVPGAFTPGCSRSHLPGFVARADEILARGVDRIACLSVNDAFVMGAWQQDQGADKILMLADGNGDFTRAAGLELDVHAHGMGVRSTRYALIAEDGVIRYLGIDTDGIRDSSAEAVLAQL